MRPADGRRLHAARLLRKLFALGLDQTEISALTKSISMTFNTAHARQVSDTDRGSDVPTRLARAQYAIRQLMAGGFIESDIAVMVGVSPGSIAHIIEPGSCRSVSRKLLAKLERALQTSGWERLKTLVPHIPVSVLDTCNLQGAEVDEATLRDIEERLPRSLLRALIPGLEPWPPPDGIHAVLARVGNPLHEFYLLKLWSSASPDKDKQVAHLKRLEHELEHIVNRVRERRVRLEAKIRLKSLPDRTSGNIA
jgi:hypothetical protein